MSDNCGEPNCKYHSGIVAKIEDHDMRLKNHNSRLTNIEQRLPVWATLLLSVLTFAIGVAFTYARFAAFLSQKG